VRQIVEDYGPLEGVCVDVGCGTAIFAMELSRRTRLRIYALEREREACYTCYSGRPRRASPTTSLRPPAPETINR